MKKILVYQDRGVGRFSYKSAVSSLGKSLVCQDFKIEKVDAKTLLNTNWQTDCSLLVIPGGRDIPYHRALNGKGTDLIRSYIEEGGSYLGICAGAYFGSKDVVFEEGNKHEVIENRELAFFPGRAVGTIYVDKPFSYQSQKSVHPALIQNQEGALYTYYNGGCYFEKAADFAPDVEILACYKNAILHDIAAIVLCKVGTGKAVLSGVHFEVDSSVSKKDVALFEKFDAHEKKRQKLFDDLLTCLLS